MDIFKLIIIKTIIGLQNFILTRLQRFFFDCSNNEDCSNICIYRIANIGDTLCAIPSIYKIREKYPDAKITLLTSPGKRGAIGASKILSDEKWIDNIDEYYTDDIGSWHNKKVFFKTQKEKNYDCFIQLPSEATNFRTQIRNLLFVKMLGVKAVTGFYISTTTLFPKYQFKNMLCPNEVERLFKNLFLQTSMHIQFPITFIAQDKKNVIENLKSNKILHCDKVLVISFSGKASVKEWLPEGFNEIARRWITTGGKVIVIGGKEEIAKAEVIIDGLPKDKSYSFCGKLSIKQSMYLLGQTMFLLTIDTGTAHMASVMGTPCITLFSSYYFPHKWVAYGDKNTVIRHPLACSPCLKKECRYGKVAKCMKAITVDEVWHTMRRILGD